MADRSGPCSGLRVKGFWHALAPALLLAALAACMVVSDPAEPDASTLIAALQSADAGTRTRAAESAWEAGPAAIEPVGLLLASPDPAAALSAGRALWAMAHRFSRPGAPEERTAASSAFLELLGRKDTLSLETRLEVLGMLAVTADDETTIRGLDRLLEDAELAETALRALERIDHPAAGRVLIVRLVKDAAVSRASVARTLGRRRCIPAVRGLLILSHSEETEESAAALHALALIADPRAEKALRNAAAANRAGGADDLLIYAEGRLAAGDRERALEIFSLLLDHPEPHIRSAALRGLESPGEAEQAPTLGPPPEQGIPDTPADPQGPGRAGGKD